MAKSIPAYCEVCFKDFGAVICDVEHYFCTCTRVVAIWNRVKELALDLLGFHDISNSRLISLNPPLKRCPAVASLIGAFMLKVWNTKNDSTICKEELFGFLRYKFKVGQHCNNSQVNKVCSKLR